ncbi:hypothetical protein HPB50_016442 [Hyalomma asiaticum]|uniref:Uncharacterized protein n=1 Tax=Hyalomma asiaticum TaxID=266040 RepID=A0ACB7STD8_HYAAI|nr:hypothetical protein HPB50_016442 [Hyalomma asiaticum]
MQAEGFRGANRTITAFSGIVNVRAAARGACSNSWLGTTQPRRKQLLACRRRPTSWNEASQRRKKPAACEAFKTQRNLKEPGVAASSTREAHRRAPGETSHPYLTRLPITSSSCRRKSLNIRRFSELRWYNAITRWHGTSRSGRAPATYYLGQIEEALRTTVVEQIGRRKPIQEVQTIRILGDPFNSRVNRSFTKHRFLRTGLHNTASEFIRAHHTSEVMRLVITKTGRKTLSQLDIETGTQRRVKQRMSHEWTQDVITKPLPRNMHPQFHRHRRRAWDKCCDAYLDIEGAFFVDAAGPVCDKYTASVIHQAKHHYLSAPEATSTEEARIFSSPETLDPPSFSWTRKQPTAIPAKATSDLLRTESSHSYRPDAQSGNSSCGYPATVEFEATSSLTPRPENYSCGPPTPASSHIHSSAHMDPLLTYTDILQH